MRIAKEEPSEHSFSQPSYLNFAASWPSGMQTLPGNLHYISPQFFKHQSSKPLRFLNAITKTLKVDWYIIAKMCGKCVQCIFFPLYLFEGNSVCQRGNKILLLLHVPFLTYTHIDCKFPTRKLNCRAILWMIVISHVCIQ